MREKSEFRKYLDSHIYIKKIIQFLFYRFYYSITTPFRCVRSIADQDWYQSQLNIVTETHKESFSKYKNKYNNKAIAIIATGPSLNKYKPISNTVSIGVNRACFYNKITLDYFFAADYFAIKDYLAFLKNNKNKYLEIFMGRYPKQAFNFPELKYISIIPESIILELGAKKYYTYSKYPPYNVDFNTDIDKTWLVEGGSTIFAAAQFALYTNPSKIYLVGCDCSTGYFDTKNDKIRPNRNLIKVWKEFKKFACLYYPDTEIISVNPVGLKGVFTDLYQD